MFRPHCGHLQAKSKSDFKFYSKLTRRELKLYVTIVGLSFTINRIYPPSFRNSDFNRLQGKRTRVRGYSVLSAVYRDEFGSRGFVSADMEEGTKKQRKFQDQWRTGYKTLFHAIHLVFVWCMSQLKGKEATFYGYSVYISEVYNSLGIERSHHRLRKLH